MNRFISFHKTLILCAISFLFSNSMYAQVSLQWARFYNGPANSFDHLVDMVSDASGNIYVTGTSNGILPNVTDFATIKYNSAGVQMWVARYNGPANDEDVATAMAIDATGNIYVTGFSKGIGTGSDIAVVKYNNAGIQQWIARYNGPANGADYSSDISVDASGNVYVTGYAVNLGVFPDYVTVKFNASGIQQWAQLYDGPANALDWAFGIAVNPTTLDVYVTGFTEGIGTDDDYTTIKYNSAGMQQWIQRYNGPANGEDDAKAIGLDASGNIYITGVSPAPGSFTDYTTIKYNSAGMQQWLMRYNGPASSYDQANAMVVDPAGNVYVTGFTDNASNLIDCATVKYNSAGIQQWAQLYNGPGNTADQANAIAIDNSGNVYITGATNSSSSTYDYLTIKYDGGGILQWVDRYNVFNNLDNASAIAVDIFNDVYVGGSVRSFDSGTANDDYGIIKYVQPIPLTVHATPDTAIYYGYGSNCLMLKAEAVGGTGNYSYSWSPGGSSPNGQTTTVCPTFSTTYTVTVTDAIQMTVSDQVTVQVIDVRCGNKDKKVLICHNGNTLCIAPEAVAAHLKHGDQPGNCIGIQKIIADDIPEIFAIQIFPNPSSDQTRIIYDLPFNAHVVIQLYDMLGRIVAPGINEHNKAGRYSHLINTRQLPTGTYQCRITATSPDSTLTRTARLIVVQYK